MSIKLFKSTMTILGIVSTIQNVLGAVDLDISMSKGITSLKTTPIYDPLHTYILYGFGIVALLGMAALAKCGGANFLGHVIGSPHTSADGWKGALSCIIFIVFFIATIGWYQWAM
jgi:hypothetical protein